MASEFDKLFGPKVSKDKPTPTWPSGIGVNLLPNNIHPGYVPWPFVPKNPANVLPGKSGLKPAK